MPVNLTELCADFDAERASLFALLKNLSDEQWATPTPAEGWSVRDQVTHLAFFDDQATLSIVDPEAFRVSVAALGSVQRFVDDIAEQHQSLPGQEVSAWLQRAGSALTSASEAAGADLRVPWFGPDMTVASSMTARIMETWAHGQDVADALGMDREPTNRLKHVAFIGVRAFANSFLANDLEVPDVTIRVELFAPDGSLVRFGRADANECVSGSMLDFCLLVTQRRHRVDTDLLTVGPNADRWLDLAQAFAGPPGSGRVALS